MRKQKTNVGALSVRNTKKNLPNCAQKGNKGITLVALILTIVVLLILAVVAIRAVQGDGILSHAKNAQTKYNSAQEEEQINIALNEWKIAQNLPGNTKTMKVFLEEKLAGIGANVTDFDKYVQITMPSNRIYKIDKTTNKEYVLQEITYTEEQLNKFDKETIIQLFLAQQEQLKDIDQKLQLVLEQVAVLNHHALANLLRNLLSRIRSLSLKRTVQLYFLMKQRQLHPFRNPMKKSCQEKGQKRQRANVRIILRICL